MSTVPPMADLTVLLTAPERRRFVLTGTKSTPGLSSVLVSQVTRYEVWDAAVGVALTVLLGFPSLVPTVLTDGLAVPCVPARSRVGCSPFGAISVARRVPTMPGPASIMWVPSVQRFVTDGRPAQTPASAGRTATSNSCGWTRTIASRTSRLTNSENIRKLADEIIAKGSMPVFIGGHFLQDRTATHNRQYRANLVRGIAAQ